MAKLATLADDFPGLDLDAAKWTVEAGPASVTGHRLLIDTGIGASAIASKTTTFDMTGSMISVRATPAVAGTDASQAQIFLSVITTDGSMLTIGLVANKLRFQIVRADGFGSLFPAPEVTKTYDPNLDVYWRIRESLGQVLFSTSPSGVSGTWTTYRQEYHRLNVTAVGVELDAASVSAPSGSGWGHGAWGHHPYGGGPYTPPTPLPPIVWAWSRINPPPPISVSVSQPNVQQLVIGDWRTGPDRELAQITNRKLTLNLLEPSTISFDVTGFADPDSGRFDANLLAEGISDVMWRRNGTPLLLARLTQTADRIDASGHTVSCTCVDYRALLDRRLVLQDRTGPLAGSGKKSFGSIPLTDIVWQLISDTQSQPGGNLGLTKGIWPPSTPVYNSYEVPDGDTVWSAIQKLAAPSSVAVVTEHLQANGTNVIAANLPGFDLDIDANRRVNMYYPTRSNDRGVTLDYVAGGGGAIASIQRSIDMANYANFIRQSGGGELAVNPLTSFILLPAQDLARRPEGRWDISASDTNVLTQETLRGAAARSFDLYAKLQPTYDLTLTTDFWEPNQIGLGDVVTVNISSGRLQVVDKLRVMSITVTVDSSNRETVELTVGRPRPDMFKFLSASVRTLNRR